MKRLVNLLNSFKSFALSFMWAFGLSVLVSMFLFSSCKTIERSVNADIDTEIVTTKDTSHFVFTTTFIDSVHNITSVIEKTRIEEKYDPLTGVLQQRVVDIEKSMDEMVNENRQLHLLVDSLQSSERTDAKQNVVVKEVVKKEPLPFPWLKLLALFVAFEFVVYIIKLIKKYIL